MNKEEILRSYGLTEKETKVYLTLLPLGNINLQEISKRLDLPRTTVYNTLNYLISKGLITKIIKEDVTYYNAVEPNKLIDDLNQKKEQILSILPELEALKENIKEPSSVEIYEGFKGISTILVDVFKKKQDVLYFGSYSKSLEVLKHLPEHTANLRLTNRIPAKIIIDPYDEPRFHNKEYKKITELKFLDSMKDFPCVIFIYGNNIAMYTVEGDLIGIIIKNKEFTLAMKMIFDIYWNQAKPAKL
jgi:sugar-specific transcriptional regulator TrmB